MPEYAKLLRSAIGDGARANKFNIIFNLNGPVDFQRKLTIACSSCGVPGIKSRPYDFKFKGVSIPLPLASETSHDWNADFYLDENHEIKKFFDDWINAFQARGQYSSADGKDFIRTLKTPDGEISFSDPYMTIDVDVYQFGFDVSILPDTVEGWTAHYKIHNVFPIAFTEPAFADQDEILSLKVQFKYSYFEYETND